MQALKRALTWALAGAFVGASVSTLVAPSLISWWFAPPVPTPVDCVVQIDYAMAQLVRAQMVTALGLGALGMGLSFVLRRKPPAEIATRTP